MAKIKKPSKADLSAMLSDNVVPRKYRNQWVISKFKPPRQSKSESLRNNRDRFGNGNRWAKELLKDPEMMKLYSKRIKGKSSNAHNVAFSDYMNAPEIHYIKITGYTGAIGDEFRIKATDDFQVTSVEVRIDNKKGERLEMGDAVRYSRKPFIWVYKTTVLNPDPEGTLILVFAFDRPGNRTRHEVRIESSSKAGQTN